MKLDWPLLGPFRLQMPMTAAKVCGWVACLALFTGILLGQHDNAANSISVLLRSFVKTANAGGSLAPFLAPDVQGASRERELQYASQTFEALEISNYDLSRLRFRDESHADLQADVHWRTKHSNFSQTSTLHFIRIAGNWYFDDFEFFRFNWLGASVGAGIAIIWAGFVLKFFFDWKKRQFASKSAKIFSLLMLLFPIFGVLVYWLLVTRSRGALKSTQA
jgi:uncharacterized protein YchJ